MVENQQEPTFHVVEDQVPQYHTSVVRILSNIYTVDMLFGEGRPVGLIGEAVAMEPICVLHMSPTHAKALFIILRQQLRTYEKQWGKIPVDPDVAEKYGGELDG